MRHQYARTWCPPLGINGAMVVLAAMLGACEGPEGPRGPAGPPGPGWDGGAPTDTQSDVARDITQGDVATDTQGDVATDTPRDVAADVAADVLDATPGDVTDAATGDATDGSVLRFDVSLTPVDTRGMNLSALHNPASRQYNPDCLHCHGAVLVRTTLRASIQDIHPRMLPYVPTYSGSVDNGDCVYCHNSVDFSGDRSAGNLRRQVRAANCAACHSSGRSVFYQP